MSLSIEEENVKKIYSIIANDFNRTRSKVWPSVKKFIESFKEDSKFLEIGCGNGKNMLIRPNYFIGCDICNEFIQICRLKSLNVINCCATKLKFVNNQFDATISIAVLHHLSTKERRIQAINEQIRVTKPGGKMLIEVWGKENNNRVKNGNSDTYVPWKYNNNTYQRYYHFFTKDELIQLLNLFENIKIENIFSEKFNWVIIIEKLN